MSRVEVGLTTHPYQDWIYKAAQLTDDYYDEHHSCLQQAAGVMIGDAFAVFPSSQEKLAGMMMNALNADIEPNFWKKLTDIRDRIGSDVYAYIGTLGSIDQTKVALTNIRVTGSLVVLTLRKI